MIQLKPKKTPVRKSTRLAVKSEKTTKSRAEKPYELESKPKKQKTELNDRVKRFMCVCEKTFLTKEAMLEHVRIVHGGDRYVCSICLMQNTNIWFESKAALLLHCNQANHDFPECPGPIPRAAFLFESEEEDSK